MSKIRVYEYAKKHNISSKDVITKLKEMNIEVSNHMATIEDADIVKLDATYNKKEDSTQQKQAKPQQQNRQNQRPWCILLLSSVFNRWMLIRLLLLTVHCGESVKSAAQPMPGMKALMLQTHSSVSSCSLFPLL